MSSRTVVFLAVVISLVLAAPASAIIRHAAPAAQGAGDCTSAADACSLADGIAASTSSDDVLLLAGGTYPTVSSQLNQPSGFALRAADPAARPTLVFSGDGQLFLAGSAMSDLNLHKPTTSAAVAPLRNGNGALIEGLAITVVGTDARGMEMYGGTVRNSTIVATGGAATAVMTQPNGSTITAAYRNVTVLASGANSRGLDMENVAANAGSTTVTVSNSIVRGADQDIYAFSGGTTPVTVTVDHSNYGSAFSMGTGAQVVSGAGNQTAAPPVFVDQAGGDLRQASGSPTIDAGADDALNGVTDLAGVQRTINVTDIGAHEFQPAPILGTPAAAVDGSTATITVPVTAGGIATTARIDYGTTTAYGSTTAQQDAGSAVGPTTQTFTLAGLSPGTTYHAQVVASNAGGTTTSTDFTFTTAPPPVMGPPLTPPVLTPPAVIGATVLSKAARMSRQRRITFTLACPASATAGCAGRLVVRSGKLRNGKAYSLVAGQTAKVTVRLSRKFAARVRRRSPLKAHAVTAAGGVAAIVKLRRPRVMPKG